jgi:hypothetical protein
MDTLLQGAGGDAAADYFPAITSFTAGAIAGL